MLLSDEESRALEYLARNERRNINRIALDNRLRGNRLALENLKRRTEAAIGDTQNYVRAKNNYETGDDRNGCAAGDRRKTVVNR